MGQHRRPGRDGLRVGSRRAARTAMTDDSRLRGSWAPRFGRATRDASLLSIGTQLEAVLSFLTVIALTRSTSITVAGEVFFAQALAAVIFLVLDPRLDDSLQRFGARLEQRGHRGAAAT